MRVVLIATLGAFHLKQHESERLFIDFTVKLLLFG